MECKKTMQPARVVIIGTQFIETNPLSFKSVVQSLTGKDSCVSWVEETSYKSRKRRRTLHGSTPPQDAAPAAAPATAAAMLSKCRPSFKDWDGLMLELPPAEEMRWVWSDY